MTPMTPGQCDRLRQTEALNDEACAAILRGDYERASMLLVQAAAVSPTARQALLDRAVEAAEMGVSTEALAAKARRGKSA